MGWDGVGGMETFDRGVAVAWTVVGVGVGVGGGGAALAGLPCLCSDACCMLGPPQASPILCVHTGSIHYLPLECGSPSDPTLPPCSPVGCLAPASTM